MQKDCVSFNTEVLFESVNHFHFREYSSLGAGRNGGSFWFGLEIRRKTSARIVFFRVELDARLYLEISECRKGNDPKGENKPSNGCGTGDSRTGDFLLW